ncbi:DNA repair protein RecN [Candidatus Izimaplasma bacterium HR1]|jgi:DNA repair protein RecN (Recombination protein N)|uniref:DNA repair protein RecN n=1 Tax=Candidatus Izimoplasma sp. HR1 TaxID=1541959 RepID=UPI0004F626DA|nr:DNA repair protein RecN [Candidatus Izimaplasma bacterium HR1]
MLSYISVKNFAIIENIEVEFKKGMTSLTGETGAGKSLLIDAIGLLLGDRATSNIVRTGSNKAEVEGIFNFHNPEITRILNNLGIDALNNELVIRRQITPSNNNIIKVNSQTVTLKDLKEITSKLADIHTQMDTHRLINPLTYLDIIDGFKRSKIEDLTAAYQENLKEYKSDLKELKRLENSNNDLLERLDLMRFQLKEIESYDLEITEEETLEQEVEKLENFDKIYQSLQQAKQLLESTNAIASIYDASKYLEEISDINESYKELLNRFNSSYFELDDACQELSNEASNLDFNPTLLDGYQERLNSLDSLKRKYKKSIPEILEYHKKIKKDINNIDNFDEVINNQIEKVKTSFNVCLKSAKIITSLREEISKFIEVELLKILADLELDKTDFKVCFNEVNSDDYKSSSIFFENGIDEVDFLLTTNVGEPKKSLSKSASGGEMSRIMLGFKNLLTKSLGLSLIIFDEIDTGVSGYVANQVAKKMVEIANNTQVICITHIPQVASISNHHLKISKSVSDGRTSAHIKELYDKDRVLEIAEMISGDIVTEASINTAKELLDNKKSLFR